MLINSRIKHKQELSINDIYLFLNSNPNIKFHYDTRPMKPSEFAMYKKNILIDYWMGNEITNDNVKEYLKVLFKLNHKWFIIIHIKEFYSKNKFFIALMKKYKRNESEFWWIKIIEKKYKWSIWDKLFWPKAYDPHYGINYYINDLLDFHLDEFLDMFELWLDFNMKVFDTFMFADYTLRFIVDLQNKNNEDKQINDLYNEFKSNLWDKKNYWWDIIFSYPIKDYVETKWYYYKILYKLYEKEIINFKEIYIQENYVNFIINKIVNFDKEAFNDLLLKKKSSLIWEILNINWDEIKVNKIWKWEYTQYYEILDLIYKAIEETWSTEISFSKLEEIRNKQQYSKIWKIVLDYDLFHDSLKDIEEKIKIKGYWNSFFGISSFWINAKF